MDVFATQCSLECASLFSSSKHAGITIPAGQLLNNSAELRPQYGPTCHV